MYKKLKLMLVFVLFLPLAATVNFPVKATKGVSGVEGKSIWHPERIIVKFKAGVPEQQINAIHSKYGTKKLLGSIMIPGLQLVKLPKGLNVKKAVIEFNKEAVVQFAEPDYKGYIDQTYPNDPEFPLLWGMDQASDVDIDAPEAWDYVTGNTNAVVAVIDTGVDYNHEDLAANIWTNPNEILNGMDDDGNGVPDDIHGFNAIATGAEGPGCGGNSSLGDPMDDYGHGTHVSGTLAGHGNNFKGVAGVNWRSKIMACKWIGADGSGYTSDAIKCFEYVWFEKVYRGINVIASSNSWHVFEDSKSLYEAIKAHMEAGILAVFAAGNDGVDTDTNPNWPSVWNLPNIIAVGGIDAAGNNIFNWGRKTVDVHAPADNILSTCSYTQYQCGTSPDYQYAAWSGTSMATPHVAGLAALLKAQDPTRDWRTIKNLILAGAKQMASLANLSVTQGLLNAFNSVQCSNRKVFSILEPVPDPVSGYVNAPIRLSALNIDCGNSIGWVQVQATGPSPQTIDLFDDGIAPDMVAGDGIFTGNFIPTAAGAYTLTFSNQDGLNQTNAANIDANYTTYVVSSETFNWRNITVGGTPLNIDDENVAAVATPFPIQFYGSSYSTIYVGSNGTLSFDGSYGGYGDVGCLPSANYNGMIFPWWEDLDSSPDNPGQVYYKTLSPGPSGDTEFVISYVNVEKWPGSDPISFQVIFFQSSSDIVFQYLDTISADGCDNGSCAVVGMQKNSATANEYSCFAPALTDQLAFRWKYYQNVGVLSVQPGSLNFGFTSIPLTMNAVLYNQGNDVLSVDTITGPSLPEFSIVNMPTLPLVLNPGESYTLTVMFAPDQGPNVPFSDSIAFNWSSGSASGYSTLGLQGWGVSGPDIQSDTVINYGQVNRCGCDTKDATISNVGYADLIITDIEMSAGNFSLVGVSLPITIPAGSSAVINVQYCAVDPGTQGGQMVIYSNDPDEPIAMIYLSAFSPLLDPSASCTGIFADVGPSNVFCTSIEGLYNAGVVSGCSTVPQYCPLASVPREQMAKYIALATCVPISACTGGVFTDVGPSNVFCSYIEGLANAGIVSGCTSNQYCPSQSVKRDQMTKYICNGMNYANPGSCATSACTGMFTDVPASNPFCPYIEALVNAGVIGGCGPNTYCPSLNVSRETMAKFIINAFD